VRLDEQPFVGSADARVVHGHSAGGDLVLVGGPASDDLLESLAPFGMQVSGPWDAGTDWLARLASLAERTDGGPMAVVASGLQVSPVALLDLLDRPGDPTATVTVEADVVTGDGMTVLRVQPDQRLVHSVGSARHGVTAPTTLGLGVLRIGRADRADAARLWRAAATSQSASDPLTDPFDVALLVLVRGGIRVATAPLGPFRATRGGARTDGVTGSAWQQRLRGASRGGDGYFSTRVIRPMSRRVTGFGLRHGWSPNVVTVTSLGLGLVASGLAAVDNRWTWVAAAILLQAAIVVDCVDGEIARFTRRFSALGAWLDAVGDRIKEYSLLAAVAWVAVRRGEDAWMLAVLAMVLVTDRHLEDYAYLHRAKRSRDHVVPDLLPVDAPRDLGPADAPTQIPPPWTRRQEAVYWTKKVLHMPIAERYLVLSLGLLTFNPQWLLWALVLTVAFAMVWTQGGRTAKALLGVDGFRPEQGTEDGHWGHLDHQVDLGPLARTGSRLARLPVPAAFLGVAVVLASAVAAARGGGAWLVVAGVVAGVLVIGAALRPPVRHRLAWQLPAVLWVTEAAVAVGVAWQLPESRRWVVFAYLAAVAWHRYDVVYRLRDTGEPSRPWVTAVTLGVDGRVVALVVVWALGWPVASVLSWGALVLIVVYAVESAMGWRTWARAQAVARRSREAVA
jgi:phosphatidylglycerophosphate synthase